MRINARHRQQAGQWQGDPAPVLAELILPKTGRCGSSQQGRVVPGDGDVRLGHPENHEDVVALAATLPRFTGTSYYEESHIPQVSKGCGISYDSTATGPRETLLV